MTENFLTYCFETEALKLKSAFAGAVNSLNADAFAQFGNITPKECIDKLLVRSSNLATKHSIPKYEYKRTARGFYVRNNPIENEPLNEIQKLIRIVKNIRLNRYAFLNLILKLYPLLYKLSAPSYQFVNSESISEADKDSFVILKL